MSSDPGSIRNLEQLQEDDDARRMPRGVTMIMVALGGACVVFAGLALGGRTSQPPAPKSDPLGDLVSQRSRLMPAPTTSARPATDLQPSDVTFPGMLSDDSRRPTTALAAVRPSGTAAANAQATTVALPPAPQPPPPTDRLSVVPVAPLPAQAVLEASPIVTRPRDALTKAASDAAQIDTPPPSSSDTAPAGHEGGYQLQVSSFRTQAEAQAFADQLRARSHKAYVVEAHVPGRGTWFRVRVGPFSTKNAVLQYRTGFEAREHVVPFVVAPDAPGASKTH
jgi:cell division septation protein DedD